MNLLIKLINNCKALIYKNPLITNIFNISIVIFLGFICYKFFYDISGDWKLIIGFLISFMISALISSLILNKFNYSENLLIRVIQRTLIYSICLYVLLLIFVYLGGSGGILNIFSETHCESNGDKLINLTDESDNKPFTSNSSNSNNSNNQEIINVNSNTDDSNNEHYNIKISKKLVDKTVEVIRDSGQAAIQNIVPNLGAGTAAGAAVSAAFKGTAGLPMLTRLGVVGGTALVTAAGTKVGLDIGSSIVRNIYLDNAIKESKHSNVDLDQIPSPEGVDIMCTLEQGDMLSPLEELLRSQLSLNILILILVIILLISIFNRYVLKLNLNLINSLNDKYVPDKYKYIITKYTRKGSEFNSKFLYYMFIFNSIIIILLLLLNIYVSLELSSNTHSYVQVYNHLHNKESIILALSINSYNIKNEIRHYSTVRSRFKTFRSKYNK